MASATPPDKPNILIVMTDHQRGDTVLPEPPCITPNLDRFAREGVTFTETFCPSPHCCPARATFMTGLYPSRHGVWNNVCNTKRLSPGLKEGVRLWSQDLAEAGYDLRWTGKWHVDARRDADQFGWRILSDGRDRLDDKDWAHWQAVARETAEKATQKAEATDDRRTESMPSGSYDRPGYGPQLIYETRRDSFWERRDGATAEHAEAAIRDLAGSEAPWAVFAGFLMPHAPYVAAPEMVDRYDLDAIELPGNFDDDMADKPALYRRMRRMGWGKMSREAYRDAIRHFYAMCTKLDEYFGRLLRALEETGQAENTLVVYTADHGDYCGEHGLFCKGIPAFRGPITCPWSRAGRRGSPDRADGWTRWSPWPTSTPPSPSSARASPIPT